MPRLPAEFEAVERVFLSYPHSLDTWYQVFDEACAEFDYFKARLKEHVEVIDLHLDWKIPTRDSWVRDYGPLFTLNHENTLEIMDFKFNGWGDLYDDSYHIDNAVPQLIADRLSLPMTSHQMVLEGGAIDSNGQGQLITSSDCLLDPQRNPNFTKAQLTDHLVQTFGLNDVYWIDGVIQGDDTNGHIDELLRFVRPNTLANALPDQDHLDYHTRCSVHTQARDLRNSTGQSYELITLPCPAPWRFDYPATHAWEHAHPWVPMSYTNFLICNGVLFLPTFDDPADEKAIGILRDSLPEFDIMPIPSRHLAVGRGSLHCLTMQQPAIPPKPRD